MQENLKPYFVNQHLPDEEILKIITDSDVQVKNEKIKLLYNRRDSILQSLEGRTIYITALNIDIVNSSRQVKILSDEQKEEYYRKFIESTSNLIQHYGGYVLKTVGDCVIGFFLCGGDMVENHDKAVSCGLTMSDMLKNSLNAYFAERKIPAVRCRTGADFGQVKVLEIRTRDGYSATDLFGTAMNSVAKITHYAKPEEMVIGDNLFWRLVDSEYLDFRLLKRWELIGKHSYPVYRAVLK